MKSASKKYSVGFRIWINAEDAHFIDSERVKLLEHVKNTGSITKGAKAIKMSYRHAWQMIDGMNKIADKPLVEKILGGKGGGGARVTERGEKAIKAYYKLEDKIMKLSKKLSKTLN